MPAKPRWFADLQSILNQIEAHPLPYLDRSAVQVLLRVGCRRAQQILAPCVTGHVGSSGLVDRKKLIERLQQLAQGEQQIAEVRRRRKVAVALEQLYQERTTTPSLLVEAPTVAVNQTFQDLPSGIHIRSGHISIEFSQPIEALEKLLSLAMAISNHLDQFESMVRKSQ